jgi:hypothetical protein
MKLELDTNLEKDINTLEKQYKTFKAFYPYYLSEHSSKINRTLHFCGTLLILLVLIFGLVSSNYKWFIAIPFLGYGFAWVGHFFVEKNKPATFTYPLYSLGADFVMFWHMLIGQIDKKLSEIKKNN